MRYESCLITSLFNKSQTNELSSVQQSEFYKYYGSDVHEIGSKRSSWNDRNATVVITLEGLVIYSLVNQTVDLSDKNLGNIKYFAASCIVPDELAC